jgi:hypothetical protein
MKKFKIKDSILKKIFKDSILKKISIFGIILTAFKVFGGLLYTVGKWYFYAFDGRFLFIKKFLIFCGVVAIIIWSIIMYLGINYIY